jgi:hypothetical protein
VGEHPVLATWQTLALEQVWPEGQDPHESVPPQPSEIVPQVFPCAAHVVGVQAVWQTLALEQVWPEGQDPHESVPLQPSEIVPQVFPCAAHVVGVQTTVVVQELETSCQAVVPQAPLSGAIELQ